MEPLSLSASVIAVLQLSGTVLSYLNSAKNLNKDLAKLTLGAVFHLPDMDVVFDEL